MDKLPFNNKHEKFRRRLRDFLESEVIPYVDQWETDHLVPRDIWRKLGREGFLCTAVSKAYGGLGGDFLYSVIMVEELARTNHTGLLVHLHSDIVVPYIDTFGSVAQKEKYLPGCVSGDIVTAVAMTEPDAGSDLASMTSTAVEEGGQVVINGAKTFISNGIHCDLVVLAVKDPAENNPHKAVSLYLVEDGTPGFKKGNLIEKMGMHSQDTAELFFTNCRIPIENRLGEKGEGFIQLMQKLQQERLLCAVWPMAMAGNMLKWTSDFCRKTRCGEKVLAASQAIQFALVEMETDLRIGTAFLNDLIMAHDLKKQVVAETSMAKFWMTEKANQIANRCLDVIGDFAAREECPVVRTWRDVRVHTIFAGTNEIMKGIIAKSMNL
jgi:alkylation response protein AidB-like acyl-CoA dehydrogenase